MSSRSRVAKAGVQRICRTRYSLIRRAPRISGTCFDGDPIKPTLDEISDGVIAAFPKVSAAEQRVSLATYRLLAKGRPGRGSTQHTEVMRGAVYFFAISVWNRLSV